MMAKYIDSDAFFNLITERYCTDCEKRKGTKNGLYQFVYEIGEAPCRACVVDGIIDDLEDIPAINIGRVISETATVDGYPIKDIIAFASVCRAAGISNEEVKEFIHDATAIYETIYADIHRSIERSLQIGLEGK